DCRLCGSRRRERKATGRATEWRRAGAQSKRISRRRSPLANQPSHAQAKVEHFMREPHTNCSTLACACEGWRSEEHTSELQSRGHLVCRLLLEKKKEHIHNESR